MQILRVVVVAALAAGCRDDRIVVTAAHVSDLQQRVGELELSRDRLREEVAALRKAAPDPHSARCGAMAAALVARIAGDAEASVRAALCDVFARRCTEDRWPETALACFETAGGQPQATVCRGMLSPEHGDRLRGEQVGAVMPR